MEYNRIIIKGKEDQKTIIIAPNQLIDIDKGDCCIRSYGQLRSKAFYLPEDINGKAVKWIIARDTYGDLCVIPLLKES